MFYQLRTETLRQIPELAIDADGRNGWSDSLSGAYNHGLLPLHHEDGYYDLYINLLTGELVVPEEGADFNFRRASDQEIFERVVSAPQNEKSLDGDIFLPVAFINALVAEAGKPYKYAYPDELERIEEDKAQKRLKVKGMLAKKS